MSSPGWSRCDSVEPGAVAQPVPAGVASPQGAYRNGKSNGAGPEFGLSADSTAAAPNQRNPVSETTASARSALLASGERNGTYRPSLAGSGTIAACAEYASS